MTVAPLWVSPRVIAAHAQRVRIGRVCRRLVKCRDHPDVRHHPMTTSCPCCDALQWEARWPGFVICRVCGLMTVEGHFRVEELKKQYGEDYFHGREYVDYVADAAVQRK